MAKFCGIVGYVIPTETRPGVWKDTICEKKYYGDVMSNTRRWEKSEGVNDNVNLNNRISIVADKFAMECCGMIRFVDWMGASWKVTNVEIQSPRLILTIGGIYNGNRSREETT